ncbi:Uma2 family endonuclease [Alkalinema pantanalense CENA528]|uniref:Uma2 family endonuclease n=1 Tax=Alkalinema pantanalense TaxID=1620705 RepID=UPI003D6E8933
MSIAQPKSLTLEEFLHYDDNTDTRYELEDGVLIAMGAESPLNTWIAVFLILAFRDLGLAIDRFGLKHLLQVDSYHVTARDPDLIIHSEQSAAALDDGRKESCLRLSDPTPLIVVEIVSPGPETSDNYKRDYDRKPKEYAARGIPEMWQVDATRNWVRVGTLTDGTYHFTTFQGSDRIQSPTFPSLDLTAAAILHAGR